MTIAIERETTISFNDAEECAVVWSSNSLFQRKMAKQNIQPYKQDKRGESEVSCWYTIPKKWIRVRKPKPISKQQREQGHRLARSMHTAHDTAVVSDSISAGGIPTPTPEGDTP